MNKLVVVGCMGIKRCYLNVSREEAIKRFLESEDWQGVVEDEVREFEFDDEFAAYDAYPI